jgi:two-component system response regulator FixJ
MDSNPRIAIVDPDPGLWRTLGNALRDLQVDITTYPSAEVLLAASDAQSLNCIVAEMHLPGASGLDLMVELRRLNINVPTIILSSQLELADAVSAMRAGAIDYLQKPFVHRRVRDWVRQLVQLAPA